MKENETTPILFVTNRFNLLEILSSSLIKPRAAFGKYYKDSLEICQGRIPLFKGPLTADLVAHLSPSDENSFPVAVEIDATEVASLPITGLSRSGEACTASLGDNRVTVWAGGGALPSRAFKRVHFRSKQELEEHQVRQYDNIQVNALESSVTPSLFQEGSADADSALPWLASLQPIMDPAASAFDRHDRLAGARCLVAYVARAESIRCLGSFLGGIVSNAEVGGFPPWLTVENTLRPRDGARRGRGLDERLYSSAVGVLQLVRPAETWRPLQVLDDVEAAVMETHPSKRDAAQLSKQFVAMRAILRSEKEFRPFRPGHGNSVIKALLMALMRAEPSRLLSWSSAESGAHYDVLLTAAALVGVLQGHRRLSIEYRSLGLDRMLGVAFARDISVGLSDVYRPAAERIELQVSKQPRAGDDAVALSWDATVVVEKAVPHSRLLDLIGVLDLQQPAIVRVLAELCAGRKWTDCIRSVVTTSDRKWNAAPRGQGLEIEVMGPVSVRTEIQMEALRERISEATFSSVEEELLIKKLQSGDTRRAGTDPGVASSPSGSPNYSRHQTKGY